MTTSTTTTTTVSGSPNPATFGQSVTFTATVAAGGSGTPTGTVTFTDGTTTLGSAAVDSGGHAAINVSTLAVGGHTVLASFAGSGTWQNSSGSTTENVQDGTSTSVAGSPNPSSYQQSVTFTATVTPAGTGAGTPVGSVTFKDGATTLATVAVDSTGRASFSTSSLTVGSHTISASFAGSGGWLSSSGSTTQTVNGPTDVTPPNAVPGVAATPGPPKRAITVKWSATTDPGGAVAAYLVYSSSAQNGTYTVIATVTTLSYTDALPSSGTTRWYYIVARDTAGNLSAPTAKVSANAK